MLDASLCFWVLALIEIKEGEEEAPQGDGRASGRVLETEDQHDGRTGVHRKLTEKAIAAVVLWNPLVVAGRPHHKVNGDLIDHAHCVVPQLRGT